MLTPDQIKAFIRQNVPACPFAEPMFVDDPARQGGQVLLVNCSAPASCRQPFGYGEVCPHKGPFRDEGEAAEFQQCPVLQTGRAQGLVGS